MRLRRPRTLLSEETRCALIRVAWRTLQRTPRHLVKQRVKKSVAQQQLDHAGSVLRIIIPELGAHPKSTLRLVDERNSKYSTSHCKLISAQSRKLPNDTEKKPPPRHMRGIRRTTTTKPIQRAPRRTRDETSASPEIQSSY